MRSVVEEHEGGWDEELQQMRFARGFDEGRGVEIIEVGGRHAGVLRVDESPADLHLYWILLRPEFQGGGLGARIVQDLLDRARAEGRTVSLQVHARSRARAFYSRLGFRAVDERQGRVRMVWSARPGPLRYPDRGRRPLWRRAGRWLLGKLRSGR
jgi:GNAT superfamily N-acetyltransferase